MEKHTSTFVEKRFSNYYESCHKNTLMPSSADRREFGFTLHGGKIMIRHKSFRNFMSLKNYLISTAPSNAYFSSAIYQYPKEAMEKKYWLGADLVFDIDADHIPTPCGKIHDTWTCINCGFSGKGLSPEECPLCKQTRFNSRNWICDHCLEAAKSETIKLLDMLINDFGFSKNELQVFFSGNRGYHIHVETNSIRLLDSLARKEIVDYVTGIGLKPELHGHSEKDRAVFRSGEEIKGWRSRISKGSLEFLNASPEEKATAGLNQQSIKNLIKRKKVGHNTLLKIVKWIIKQKASRIDTVVTIDIHRLIRLPGSLHGKTGLTKKVTSIKDLSQFDPLREAVAFNGNAVNVNVSEAPRFRIGNKYYGPFKQNSLELPMAAAIFLICKGVAQLSE